MSLTVRIPLMRPGSHIWNLLVVVMYGVAAPFLVILEIVRRIRYLKESR